MLLVCFGGECYWVVEREGASRFRAVVSCLSMADKGTPREVR